MKYMASSVLRTEKLCKSFSNGGVQQHVIKNLDVEIIEGDLGLDDTAMRVGL